MESKTPMQFLREESKRTEKEIGEPGHPADIAIRAMENYSSYVNYRLIEEHRIMKEQQDELTLRLKTALSLLAELDVPQWMHETYGNLVMNSDVLIKQIEHGKEE